MYPTLDLRRRVFSFYFSKRFAFNLNSFRYHAADAVGFASGIAFTSPSHSARRDREQPNASQLIQGSEPMRHGGNSRNRFLQRLGRLPIELLRQMFGSFLNSVTSMADGPSADPSMCRVLPQLGWSRDPTSAASTIAFQSPKRTQSAGSEGAILVHHESGTMSAASDPGRDGGSAVRQRFLRDSAGRRDRGAPASRPRDVGCADTRYGVAQSGSSRLSRSLSSTSRRAGGMQPVNWLSPRRKFRRFPRLPNAAGISPVS